MKKQTDQQNTELARVAKFAAASATDSTFWNQVIQNLEAAEAERQPKVEARVTQKQTHY